MTHATAIEWIRQDWISGELLLVEETVGEFLQRVGTHIFLDYQAGLWTVEELDAALESLNVCEDLWIGRPE